MRAVTFWLCVIPLLVMYCAGEWMAERVEEHDHTHYAI
jgi:hypothetical protein